MRVITHSLCFCKGVGKSEKMKASIFSGKAPAMARITVAGANGFSKGTGFLIHRNLLLTTHLNLPSVSAAESAEIRLQNGVAAAVFPHRFFITSSILDLTIVGLDPVDGGHSVSQNQQPHYLKTCPKPNLELGNVVYLLGYTSQNELKIGEGKLVVATDNLVKLSTDEMIWSPGSAGFDGQGNLAFMICDPRKLATSPNSNSSSSLSSSSSRKKDNKTLMQFGIPIPVIGDWLNQHWEGSLDEHTKPRLPLLRLMSSGQKSDHSCPSFTRRRVFKPTDADDDNAGTPPSSKTRDQSTGPGSSVTAANTNEEEKEKTSKPNPLAKGHEPGIPTPEIYESPKMISCPLRQKETGPIQHLDINFPPRIAKVTNFPSQPGICPQLNSSEQNRAFNEQLPSKNLAEEDRNEDREAEITSEDSDDQVASTGSVNGVQSEVISSSSPVEASEAYYNNGYGSEEETMYSAETAESRNYPTPPRQDKFHQPVQRSQSCVSYNRWETPWKSSSPRRVMMEKQGSFVHGKKVYSQAATSQRSNDYYSPTVSSIMKKRNSSEPQMHKPLVRAVNSSPRWMF
ncbi:PREDICTED: uncharacterized protein LOC104802659 [Tarenaya hassleriana]|uniref:uncharacterized protein LOC104802659 n=1 Tax=Tarenaya hassleriana TaxID=28532 RepID=UPI0008FD7923|nr:PREDICTED: uncharacterized protein LOC104802659 [Tarenaya hassleriana]